MLDILRSKIEPGASNVEVVQAGFLTYDHRGAKADFVYARWALHHLPDFWKTSALTRIRAILEPGGTLRLSDIVYSFRTVRGGGAGRAVVRHGPRLEIEYPERELNRVTTFFRIFVAIPILIVLAMVSGGSIAVGGNRGGIAVAGGLLFAAPLLMIVFRQKYPRWWFDWNLQLLRFENRVAAFLLLLRDEYPSTDDEQSLHLDIDYPDVPNQLNRWLPLVKWLLAIPHFVVLVFLSIAALVVAVIAWFARGCPESC